MRTHAFLSVVVVLVACEDDVVHQAGAPTVAASSRASNSAAAAAPSASSGPSACDQLNQAIWVLVREAPKACKKTSDCVIVGPGACRLGKVTKSCVAAIAKGNEGPIDDASKRWEAAGCDKGLPEVQSEKLACKAGQCTMLFDRS